MRRDKGREVEAGFNQDAGDLSAAVEPIKEAQRALRCALDRVDAEVLAEEGGGAARVAHTHIEVLSRPAAQLVVVELFEQTACVDDPDAGRPDVRPRRECGST